MGGMRAGLHTMQAIDLAVVKPIKEELERDWISRRSHLR